MRGGGGFKFVLRTWQVKYVPAVWFREPKCTPRVQLRKKACISYGEQLGGLITSNNSGPALTASFNRFCPSLTERCAFQLGLARSPPFKRGRLTRFPSALLSSMRLWLIIWARLLLVYYYGAMLSVLTCVSCKPNFGPAILESNYLFNSSRRTEKSHMNII